MTNEEKRQIENIDQRITANINALVALVQEHEINCPCPNYAFEAIAMVSARLAARATQSDLERCSRIVRESQGFVEKAPQDFLTAQRERLRKAGFSDAEIEEVMK